MGKGRDGKAWTACITDFLLFLSISTGMGLRRFFLFLSSLFPKKLNFLHYILIRQFVIKASKKPGHTDSQLSILRGGEEKMKRKESSALLLVY